MLKSDSPKQLPCTSPPKTNTLDRLIAGQPLVSPQKPVDAEQQQQQQQHDGTTHDQQQHQQQQTEHESGVVDSPAEQQQQQQQTDSCSVNDEPGRPHQCSSKQTTPPRHQKRLHIAAPIPSLSSQWQTLGDAVAGSLADG